MFDIKCEYVINQKQTKHIGMCVNRLFLLCIKTITNDTVKGIAFSNCQKADKDTFLQRILDSKCLILAYEKNMTAFTFRSTLGSYLRLGKI